MGQLRTPAVEKAFMPTTASSNGFKTTNRSGWLAFLASGCNTASLAAGVYCVAVDLLLVLAPDVSRSVDRPKFLLQRDGYAAAVSDPQVLDAIKSGPRGKIALC